VFYHPQSGERRYVRDADPSSSTPADSSGHHGR
jgi:hypothetical protein